MHTSKVLAENLLQVMQLMQIRMLNAISQPILCLLTLDLKFRTVITWNVAEKPVTSDTFVTSVTTATNDAGVTNTTAG